MLDVCRTDSAQIRVWSAENTHIASFLEQRNRQVGPNEPCSTGHEDILHLPFLLSDYRMVPGIVVVIAQRDA
jgi:hypothetical protein